MSFPWYLSERGVNLEIDPDYDDIQYDDGMFVAVDVETDEKDNIVCIGVCAWPGLVWVFFDIEKALNVLRPCKFIMHNGKSDIGWLEKYGFTMDNLYWDTMVGAYVLDSSRKRYALKVLAKEDLNLEWPTYPQITEGKEYIEEACQQNPSLRQVKIKHYKRKPSVTTYINPKRLTLDLQSPEVVANYNGTDVWATWRLYQKQKQQATKAQIDYMMKLEFPTSRLVHEMEKKGIRVNLETTLNVHKTYLKKASKAKAVFRGLVGPTTLISSPSQVLLALQREGLRVKDTNYDTIKGFKDSSPVVSALLDYREASKICQTYTRPVFKRAITSPDQRIHPRFNQSTITGRFSSSDPNSQNLPPEMRPCFEAKPGHLFVNADYGQIELRLPAHFSKEPLMLEAFNGGVSIHETTSKALGIAYKTAKQVNFLITNGGQAQRLSQVAEIPLEQAEETVRAFWEKFKVLRDWITMQKVLARRTGKVTTLFGRTVPIPDIHNKSSWIREAAERTAISVKVQGSAAELMKVAMLRLWKNHGLVPVVTVHDEVMVEVPESRAGEVAAAVKAEMENVLPLNVPLVADVGIGRTWAEAKI